MFHTKYLVLLGLLIILGISICHPSLNRPSSYLNNLERIRHQYHLPGLASAVIRRDSIHISTSGLRKIDNSSYSLSTSDKFHLGSLTKAMTATVFATFVEEGLFTWDTPLHDLLKHHVPEMVDGHYNTTPAMLGAHRAGFRDEWDEALFRRLEDFSLPLHEARLLIARVALRQPPVTLPGQEFAYSNWGYILLGLIMEIATNKTWEELMRERLFDPLNMNGCGFGTPGADYTDGHSDKDRDWLAQPWPHNPTFAGPVPVFPDRYSDNPPGIGPCGTVHCPIAHYTLFLRLHMDGFNGRETKILKPESFKRLHEPWSSASLPVLAGDPFGRRYSSGGWNRDSQLGCDLGTSLSHSGTNTRWLAHAAILPGKDVIFFSATNVGGAEADEGSAKALCELVDLSEPN